MKPGRAQGSGASLSGSGPAGVCAYRHFGRSPSRGGPSYRCCPRSRAPAGWAQFRSLRLQLRPRSLLRSSLLKRRRAGGAVPGRPAPTSTQGERGRPYPAPIRRPIESQVEMRGVRGCKLLPAPHSCPSRSTLPPFLQHVYGLWDTRNHSC